MTILPDSVLVESKSARNSQLAELSHDRASEVLNKVKSLYFALWQGVGTATTEQVAEFYEVSSDVVRDNLRRHRDELESDGLKVVKGKALNEVREIFSLTPQSANVTIWTPRAALRLGMLLRDSEVAKTVRTSLLEAVERVFSAPQPLSADLAALTEAIHALTTRIDKMAPVQPAPSPVHPELTINDVLSVERKRMRDEFLNVTIPGTAIYESARSVKRVLRDRAFQGVRDEQNPRS